MLTQRFLPKEFIFYPSIVTSCSGRSLLRGLDLDMVWPNFGWLLKKGHVVEDGMIALLHDTD